MSSMFMSCCKKFPREKELLDDGTFYYTPHRIGNTILLCGRKSSHFPFQLMVGPDWPCMLITYVLLIVPTVLFIHNVGVLWDPSVTVICVLLLFITLCAYSFTACSDPGIVFTHPPEKTEMRQLEVMESGLSSANAAHSSALANNNSSPSSPVNNSVVVTDSRMIECGLCHIDRPRTAAHCFDCGVCVNDLDHHCPWTGKCIGKKTILGFYSFLWSMCILVWFVIVFVIVTAIQGKYLFNFHH